MVESYTIYIIMVIFMATLVRSTFGFGESLVAVPLLSLFIPLDVAVPLSVLVSITVAAAIVIQDWKVIHFRSAAWMVFATIFGLPLGLIFLTGAKEQVVMVVLGIVIIAFSLYFLLGKKPIQLKADRWEWLLGCGFLAGMLGGAYGLNGPPLAVYGSIRNWSTQHFRATLQGYFLPASIIGMAGYWMTGLWTSNVSYYYLNSLPALIPAVYLGRILNHRLQGRTFFRYIHFGLLGIGLFFLIHALVP